ncbi:MAG: type I-U CRISPR-associated helicase/endonuclease Cas3 [Bryobacteraceae bacterium]|nr:type I-U CRISPR-associated helicase/endonuclease Cas3 [Bryobacteraceae bacterium]MDW8378825.1 type I-U CRISPR-associated helicase/endonuclease Cas3 [Bryobacterales bacterium]
MSLDFQEFEVVYRAITGHDSAFSWQYRLFCDLEAGRFPSDIELATGLGKTSIIALWVLALGRAIRRPDCPVPRRLAYIVDRRVVVDQASEFAEQVRVRLEKAVDDPENPLQPYAAALSDAGCTPGVLQTSTLRGQRTQDTQWRDDPSRPAIIIGTVDMVGSRLLFSGYGRVGPWTRSLEAGLLGQDCLVVLDEAHLCSPFAATLAAIERQRSSLAPFGVIRMGATMEPVADLLSRTPGLPFSPSRQPFQLRENEVSEQKLRDRLLAPKWIQLIEVAAGAGQQLAKWAIEKVKHEPSASIGLILNTVEEAKKCASALKAKLLEADFITLTGSMRGYDRDTITRSKEYDRFRCGRDRSVPHTRPAFLVATSCIEVGADLDCDHLGTEVCAADSLIQRLGRVNRLGLHQEPGSTVVIVGKADDTNAAGRVFLRLQQLQHNGPLCGSPETLPRLLLGGDRAHGLFEVRVPPPALTPAVLDDLSMTSKYPKKNARVDVSRWLHGSVEDASLYVEIAWRDELDWIADVEGLARLLHSFPIAPRETARCPIYEAVEVLAMARDRAGKEQSLGNRCVFFYRDGVPEGQPLRSLPTDKDELRRLLYNALVVLPASVGGYDGRFVDPEARNPVVDVAEDAQPSNRARRCRLRISFGWIGLARDGSISSRIYIDPETTEEELPAESAHAVRTLLGAGWRLVASAGDGQNGVLVAREDHHAITEAEDDEAALGFRNPVPLKRHLFDAREKAKLLCERLGVTDGNIRTAVLEAAGGHDVGKDCPWWQRAVGSFTNPPVAKSGQEDFNHAINQGYRHELGSVSMLQQAASVTSMEPCAADLLLHLVAAHHGHGRPGFRPEAMGPIPRKELQQAIDAIPARFARVQAAHGWWGLAWLEALVKAADVLASREEEAE